MLCTALSQQSFALQRRPDLRPCRPLYFPLLPQDFILQFGVAMAYMSLSSTHLPLFIGGKSWSMERDESWAAALILVLCPGQGLTPNPRSHLCIPYSQAKDAEGVRKVKRFKR